MSSIVRRITGESVQKYRFGNFELFPGQGVLLREGIRVPLTRKPIDTLLLLVEHVGETVSKEELLAQVWKGAAVEENNLTQSISSLRKALQEKRGDNRFIVTDSGRGYRFVAPVELVTESESEDLPVAAPQAEPPPRQWQLLSLAAVLAVLIIAGSWLALRRPAPGQNGRRSVAVLRIHDLSKTSTEAWLQTALTEMLTSELAAGGKLRAIPSEDVARWHADQGAAAEDGRLVDLLRSAQKNLGTDAVVLGSYVVTGTCPDCRVRVDLGVVTAHTGERMATVIEEGSAADLIDLTGRLGRRLRTEFGVTGDIASSPRWPAASAMREYAEGLKALRAGDPLAARERLETAAATDPGNALIRSALADTWTALGYESRAKEENRHANDLAGSLDRLDQLGIEARYRASLQQWDRAIDAYKAIFQLFPDSLNDGLNLARAQTRGARVADAGITLSALRKLPPPAGNDPRIDMAEATAAGSVNDYPRTRELAHRAAEEASARGARYLYARARLLEGGAMQTLVIPGYARIQDEARNVCQQIGDRDCMSKAWRIRGNERYYFGDFQGAQDAYSKGIAIARELGNQAELANLLVGFAVVARANRDWPLAEKDLIEAIELRRQTSYSPGEVQNQLVELYLQMGRLPEAESVIAAALQSAKHAGAQEDLGEILCLEAQVARATGDLGRAQQLTDQAVAVLRGTGGGAALLLALAQSSSVATARGDLVKAGRDLAEAGTGAVPETQGMLQLVRAEFWSANGKLAEAAAEAQRAVNSLKTAHADPQAAQAALVAAAALELMHRDGEAIAACREASSQAAHSPNPVPATLARLCEWRLGAPGDLPHPDVKSPEVDLAIAYARAMHARRTGSPDTRRQFEDLARRAQAFGNAALAKRALWLAAGN